MTATEEINLADLPWSEPREVQTGQGPRLLSTCDIDGIGADAFWRLWKERKAQIIADGYSVGKDGHGDWILKRWRPATGPAPVPLPVTDVMVDYLDRQNKITELFGAEFGYQIPHIERLTLALANHRGALDTSDTGTGKTFTAAAVAYIMNRPMLVVCPLAVRRDWHDAAKLTGTELIEAINYEMLRTGRTIYGTWDDKKRFIWNRDAVPANTLIVFDECHRMKDFKTKNQKMGISAIEQGYSVLALSATAADNPMHMKFVALLTGLIRRSVEFFGFMTSHGCKKQKVSRYGPMVMQFVGGRATLMRLHEQIFPAHGSRMRIAALGDKFPTTRIMAQAYELEKESANALNRVYAEMRAALDELAAKKATDMPSIMTIILRARQEAELLKVPLFAQIARDAITDGNAVVIFVNFDRTIVELAIKLETEDIIAGDTPIPERERIRDDFNADKIPLVLCNVKAGGVGIGLHGTREGKPRLSLISPTYSGIDLKQVFGRVRRAGGAFSMQRIVFVADTPEETACKKVREVMKRIDILNEGVTGSELDGALQF